jgi:hypothetical protein
MGTIETGEEIEGVTFVESGMVTASEEGNVQLWEVADKAEVGAFAESRD